MSNDELRAAIIQVQSSGNQLLLGVTHPGTHADEIIIVRPQWRDLTSGGSWTYMPSISTHYYTRLVALSSTEAYMVAVIIIIIVIIMITVILVMNKAIIS